MHEGLLRNLGRCWQVIETPAGASLFGAPQVIAVSGLALPDSTGIVHFSWETLRFQHRANQCAGAGKITPGRAESGGPFPDDESHCLRESFIQYSHQYPDEIKGT